MNISADNFKDLNYEEKNLYALVGRSGVRLVSLCRVPHL